MTSAQPLSAPVSAESAPPRSVAIARGDGIGPEIMDAVLTVLDAASAPLDYRPVTIGESEYRRGFGSGIAPETWQTLLDAGVLLKGPITTPSGGGVKSLNVTLRKTFGLFANVRPCIAYDPYIPIRHPHLDVVIIRENEEDLLVGVDVFIHWPPGPPNELAAKPRSAQTEELELTMIANRGVKVWPDGFDHTFHTDHWRCRFEPSSPRPPDNLHVLELLTRLEGAGADLIKTEHLYEFDGERGFSLGQGQ